MHALDAVELPVEVADLLQEERQSRQAVDEAKLATLAGVLVSLRQEAVRGRQESGIEDVWAYCEEAYVGIDEANRHEFGANRWIKPPSMDGGLRKNEDVVDSGKSTIFVRMTARYVDAGTAKVQEILLAPDEKSFASEATPVPELLVAQTNPRQVTVGGIPLERDPFPHEVQPPPPATESGLALATTKPLPQDLSGAPGKPLTYADLAQETVQQAQDKAAKAEKRVYDWLVEGQHAKQMRRVVHDAARLGVGVLKGPIPDVRKAMSLSKSPDGSMALTILEKIAPVTRRISPWNFFPDPSCGDDLQAGDYTWERQPLSRRALQKLAKLPGYLPNQIAQVLKEGPSPAQHGITENPQQIKPSEAHRPFEAWFYYGMMPHTELATILSHANPYPPGTDPLDLKQELHDLPVQATIVNDRVIFATIQPLDSGTFPYHALPWSHRDGYWAGIGVGEQVMNPQRLVNAATRTYTENAGFSAGMQLIVDRASIEPADKTWKFDRNKIWWKKVDSGLMDDVRKAMTAIQFPSAHAQLSWLIEFAFRLAEESTSIPLVTQGWSGKTTPDTATGQQLQDTNANQLLRSIALMFDDYITGPLMRAFYEWLMMDPDVPDDEKGDYTIFARGSTALVERSIQEQTLTLVAPQVQAAQISAQADLQEAQARMQLTLQELELKRQLTLQELELKRQLALLEYANRRQITIDQVKASLAETTMELRTQKELAGMDGRGPQVAHPAMEPPGRAPNGQAFQR